MSDQDVHRFYHLQKVTLGEGSFAVVHRAVNRETGEVYAMKVLCKARLRRRGSGRGDVYREVALLRKMRHRNIIHVYETFEDRKDIYLALDYCDGGDFGDKIVERADQVTEPEVAFWVRQMLCAIDHMHSRNVCHRDIKPDNFLVSYHDQLKLADLGLAAECPDNALLVKKCGTPAFMAPEVHRLPMSSTGYGLQVDIWAAGVCMYMLISGGKHPFLGPSGLLDEGRLLTGTLDFPKKRGVMDFPMSPKKRVLHNGGVMLALGALGLARKHMSEQAQRFCKRMVRVDVERRLSAAAALKASWLKLVPVSHPDGPQIDPNIEPFSI